jgi:hypothetical protein
MRRLGGPQDRSGRVWTISSPQGFDRRSIQPARSESLYRLRCPGPHTRPKWVNVGFNGFFKLPYVVHVMKREHENNSARFTSRLARFATRTHNTRFTLRDRGIYEVKCSKCRWAVLFRCELFYIACLSVSVLKCVAPFLALRRQVINFCHFPACRITRLINVISLLPVSW